METMSILRRILQMKMEEGRGAGFSGKAVLVRGLNPAVGKRGKSACLGAGSRSRSEACGSLRAVGKT
jgi:hypothetical protein